MPNTVRLHRVLKAPPERVYRAFLDAGALAKWLPPNGFTGKVHHLDARVGGTFRMSFTNFTTGHSHSFGGRYVELVPHERIRHTDTFRSTIVTCISPGRFGSSKVSVWRIRSCGTSSTYFPPNEWLWPVVKFVNDILNVPPTLASRW